MKRYPRLILAAVAFGGLALSAFAGKPVKADKFNPLLELSLSGPVIIGKPATVTLKVKDPVTLDLINGVTVTWIQIAYESVDPDTQQPVQNEIKLAGSPTKPISGDVTKGYATGSVTVTFIVGTGTGQIPLNLGCGYSIVAHTDASEIHLGTTSTPLAFCVSLASFDNTPPVVGCIPTTNPSGKNEPKAGTATGRSGQNPDGFYQLVATDDVTNPEDIVIYIQDSVSGWEVEGLVSGDKFKLIQAPGVTPNVKKMPQGYWQIQFQGDAIVFGFDEAGNESESHSCLVPRPAK